MGTKAKMKVMSLKKANGVRAKKGKVREKVREKGKVKARERAKKAAKNRSPNLNWNNCPWNRCLPSR